MRVVLAIPVSAVVVGLIGSLAHGPAVAGVEPTNPQVTDSVTETNAKVIGEAPGIAMGSIYTITAQALPVSVWGADGAQGAGAQGGTGFVAGVHWVTGQVIPSWLAQSAPLTR